MLPRLSTFHGPKSQRDCTNPGVRASWQGILSACPIRLDPALSRNPYIRMSFQKITLAMTAVAAASALACTGTHEVAAKSATPDLQPAPVTVSTPSAPSAKSRAAMPIPPAADTDTVRPAALAVGSHPTPPALDSLIK